MKLRSFKLSFSVRFSVRDMGNVIYKVAIRDRLLIFLFTEQAFYKVCVYGLIFKICEILLSKCLVVDPYLDILLF